MRAGRMNERRKTDTPSGHAFRWPQSYAYLTISVVVLVVVVIVVIAGMDPQCRLKWAKERL